VEAEHAEETARPIAEQLELRPAQAECLAVLARIRSAQCKWDEGNALARDAIRSFREDDTDLRGEADAWCALGYACFERGDFPEAHANLETALRLFRRCTDDCGEIETQLLRAHLAYHMNDYSRCKRILSRVEAACDSAGYQRGLATAKRYRGKLNLVRGKWKQARDSFLESLETFEMEADFPGQARAHLSLARAHGQGCEWQNALQHYDRAESLFFKIGDHVRCAVASVTRSLLLARWEQEDKNEAEQKCSAAFDTLLQPSVLDRAGEEGPQIQTWLLRAKAAVTDREWDDVSPNLRRLQQKLGVMGEEAGALKDIEQWIAQLRSRRRRDEAEKGLLGAIETLRALDDRRHLASVLLEAARRYRDWEEHATAAEYLHEAINHASQMHAERLVERCQGELPLTLRCADLADVALRRKKHERFVYRLLDEALHDVKNPLNNLSWEVNNLIMGRSRVSDLRECLPQMQQKIKFAILMSEGAIDVEPTGEGRIRVRPTVRGLHPFVEEAIAVVRPFTVSPADYLAFENVVDQDLTAWFDDKHLLRILVNLVHNADKHTTNEPCNWIRVSASDDTIETGTEQTEPAIRITVEDSGDGIQPEIRDTLFDPFVVGGRPELAGYGIGLSYCRQAVESHGGRIWVDKDRTQTKEEDPEHHGTVVHFTLPKHAPEADEDKVEAGEGK